MLGAVGQASPAAGVVVLLGLEDGPVTGTIVAGTKR